MSEAAVLPTTSEDGSLTCGVCLNIYTNPKTLPCLHSFCKKCLETVVLAQEDGSYILGCPTCRHPAQLPKEGVESLPTASHVTSHIDQAPVPDKEDVSGLLHCHTHKQISKIYCESCEVLVCNMCAIDDHHDHEYYLMTRNFKKHLEQVRTALEPVIEQMNSISSNLEHLTTTEKEIEKQRENIKEEIHSLAERLIDMIQESETELSSQVDYVANQKLRVLSQQREEAKMVLDQTTQCHKMVDQQLSLKKPPLFLTKKREMIDNMKKAQQVRASAFEPAEAADVRFRGNGELLLKCKELGKITNTFLHKQSFQVKEGGKRVQAGMNTTFQFCMTHQDGSPLTLPHSLLSCTLIPPDSSTPLTHTVTEKNPGIYELNYTPLIDGVHQLSIEVGGLEIPSSPVIIHVAPSLGIGGKSVNIIPDLQCPWGVAINSNEQIIAVAETAMHCITFFNSEGRKLGKIGSKGKEDGKFTDPRGIAITANNHILVTDYDRIQKLTMNGRCVRSVCGKGTGPLQFRDPKGIAVHPISGKVLIADSNNHRIQVLNSDLTFSHSFGREGSLEGEFRFPWDVACDSNGDVYVVDNENHSVQKFSLEGKFIKTFGGKGSEPSQLTWPSGIAIDTDDIVYVTDDNQAVSIFDLNGVFMKRIQHNENSKNQIGFKHPLGIVIDRSGKIYVSDCWNNRLVIL